MRSRKTTSQFPARHVAFLSIVLIVAAGCEDGGSVSETASYKPAALQGRSLPEWDGTNAIALSPEKAVVAAIAFANGKHRTNVQWEVQNVSIQRAGPELPWYYKVFLIERTNSYRTESVYGLLNGEVWKPYRVQ